MTEKFDFRQFCRDNPGIKNWNPGGKNRDILSTPVACNDGYECSMPRYDLYWDGQVYKCKVCNRKYTYIIPRHKYEIGDKYQPSGWYLQNRSIFDIIKSWFKF